MKVEYVNPFVAATINTFETMLQLKLQTGKLHLKAEPFPSYDVSGIIGISGDAAGSISISFPKLVALKMVSRFLGSEIKIMGGELTDAVGELSNIIAGSAKKDLINLNVQISLPSVVIGKSHHLASPSGSQSMIVPFTSELGEMALEVTLKTA